MSIEEERQPGDDGWVDHVEKWAYVCIRKYPIVMSNCMKDIKPRPVRSSRSGRFL